MAMELATRCTTTEEVMEESAPEMGEQAMEGMVETLTSPGAVATTEEVMEDLAMTEPATGEQITTEKGICLFGIWQQWS